MIIRFEVMRGPAAGRLFTFDEPDVFVFGRDGDIQCSIPSDKGISRKHFMLQVSPPDCFLTDLGSFNGTKVNDVLYGGRSDAALKHPHRAEAGPVRLKHNDVVVAGLSQFRADITYDFECANCGVRFIVRGDDAAISAGANPLCDECRRLPAAASAGSVTRLLRCSRCGGDVSAEAGVRGFDPEVEYVCSKCRASTLQGSEILRLSRSRAALEGSAAVVEFDEDVPEPPPIDGYEHLRLIGVGGMGAVYLSRRLDTGQLVAIKTMLPEVAVKKEAAAIFERETAVAASLAHPNVVRIYQRGRVGAIFYFRDGVRGRHRCGDSDG